MNDLVLNVDTKKIVKNIKYLSKDNEPLIMVKANCYGIGIDLVEYLLRENYTKFGVTNLYEAIELRNKYKDIDIYIFTEIEEEEMGLIIKNNLSLIITDVKQLNYVDNKTKCHLKFDTGMGRVGLNIDDIDDAQKIIKNNNIYIEGVLTHLSTAMNEEVTNIQIELFKKILKKLTISYKYVHVQNTVGCIKYDLDFVNMVRPGLGIYGLLCDYEESKINNELQLAISLKAKVIKEKHYVGKVSYNQLDEINGKIYTLRIGYADGLLRVFNKFKFQNNSKIVGNICMCQTIIQNDKEIDYQEIFGDNESIYNLSTHGKITVYEMLVSLSSRIKREYK